MKKCSCLWLLICSAAIAAYLTGCCHCETVIEPLPPDLPPQNNMQLVAEGRAYNYGYYLFNTWPLYTGNPHKFDRKDYRSFHDDIRPDRNSSMLLQAMQKRYKAEKLIDVRHEESSWGWFSLWIVWRKNISTSAIGVKKLSAN